MTINTVTIAGNLGQDPEIRYFENSSSVTSASLAVNYFSKGEKQTHWLPIKAWGAVGIYLANKARKGSRVRITGEISGESWTDRESGSQRHKTVVIADWIEILPSASATPGKPTAQTRSERANQHGNSEIDDYDSIPFMNPLRGNVFKDLGLLDCYEVETYCGGKI